MSSEREPPKVVDTRPLRELLERRAEEDAARREFEQELERRLGSDWWNLPPDTLRRTCEDVAASRGVPQSSPAFAEVAEEMVFSHVFIARLKATAPGMENPLPKEVWERAFTDFARERGGLTPGAAAFARELGLDMRDFE